MKELIVKIYMYLHIVSRSSQLTHVTEWTSPASSAGTHASDYITGGIVLTLTHPQAVLAIQSFRKWCCLNNICLSFPLFINFVVHASLLLFRVLLSTFLLLQGLYSSISQQTIAFPPHVPPPLPHALK